MRHAQGLCISGLILLASPGFAASDYQMTLGETGMVDFVLQSVSSTDVYGGGLPANDPAINLIVGKRYLINNTAAAGGHPIELIAKGASSGTDTVLLSQSGSGSLEADSGINWVEVDTAQCEFTVTQALINAMRAGGKSPGYRCNAHPDDMRGAFVAFASGTTIADPVPGIPRGSITIALQSVASGLTCPIGVVDPNDASGRLFIIDQTGNILILQGSSVLGTPFLNVSSRLVSLNPGYDERGLLGFALSPTFATDKKVYTYTSEPVAGSPDFSVPMSGSPNHHSVIAEWQVSAGDPNVVDTLTRREILRFTEPQSNHNGGELAFGPDGFLYISTGDGGSADDTADGHSARGNGQDTSNVLGKILRIDVGGNNSANGKYGIPATNPFVGVAGVDEIYAYGFRNPFRFSFTGSTLVVADVGQNHVEEIDNVVLGGNYGWPIREGGFFFDNNGASSGRVVTEAMYPYTATLLDPVANYDHGDGIAIVGGYVYGAGDIPGLDGHYIFGDFSTSFSTPLGRLFYLSTAGIGATNTIVEFHTPSDAPIGKFVKGLGRDAAGHVYVCTSSVLGPTGTGGEVAKLTNGASSVRDWSLYSNE